MRAITVRDLKELHWERFEDLVAALILQEHPTAEKLAVPDGGADVLLERKGEGAKAWQAKHHPGDIHWKGCVKSLNDMVKSYSPTEVVFVFPRNMSGPVKESFKLRLQDPYPDLTVSYLSGSNLVDMLRRCSDDFKTEFFGPDPRDQALAVARHLAAEGLQVARQPAADRLAQDLQLADEAGRGDRHFRTEVALRTGETPMASWTEEPALMVSLSESDRELRIAAWPEEKTKGSILTLWFEDSEEGRQARSEVATMLARDRQATLPKGAGVRLNKVPEAIRAVSGEPDLTDVTIEATGTRRARLSGTHEGERLERTMELVTVPVAEAVPAGFETTEFGCLDGELSLFLKVTSRKEELRMAVDLDFALLDRARRGGAVDALRLLVALDEGGQFEFPDLEMEAFPLGPTVNEERAEKHRAMLRFFRALRAIEEALDLDDLPLSNVVTEEEDLSVLAAADLIENRVGEFVLEGFEGEMRREEVEALERDRFEGATLRFPVRMDVLGRNLCLGLGEAEPPRPDEIEVSDGGDPSIRRVSLGWSAGTRIPYELVAGPDGKPESSLRASGKALPPPQ